MEKYKLAIAGGGGIESILKVIVSGFFAKAARKNGVIGYETTVDGHLVHMFPGSALFGREPEFVVFHELVNTTKEFMRNTVFVDPKWLVEMAPGFYRRAEPGEVTDRKRRQRLAPLADNLRRHERDWRITDQRIVRL
jgi:ATP-dependent RNA helicase DHX8/PRP22